MAGLHFPYTTFETLIKHHAGILERYDRQNESKFSIMMFPLKDHEQEKLTKALEEVLRESDAVTVHDGYYYLVLPQTDMPGALRVKNVFVEQLGKSINEVIVTYRDDGINADEIVTKLKDYAQETYGIRPVF